MAEAQTCPQCGVPIQGDAPAGICPKCLLAAGLNQLAQQHQQHQAPQRPVATSGAFVPPSPESLTAHFPTLEILELLGQGGMGAVYKARQRKLDRHVALKVIRPESALDPAFAERFNREAKTLARLSHPNIVAIHDFGEVSLESGSNGKELKLYFFVMEYVEGVNLRQLLQASEISPAKALEIVPQVCEALQFAHDEGVVHRDIKPENILVDGRGRVKIADFGLAKLISEDATDYTLTGTHQVLGTPRYMAPEQMEGAQEVDHRADIYSLGVVFYEMLTGELPLGRFEPPSKTTTLTAEWDEVVLRALEKAPERRYQHASQVKSEIERVSDVVPALDTTPRSPVGATAASVAVTTPHASAPHQLETKPHYGMQLLGAVMVILGLVLLGMGLDEERDSVFLWVGMGIAIGGGGCFTSAFSEKGRIPAGTRANYGMLVQGGVMLAIGAFLLGFCFLQAARHFNAGNTLIWIGIGLTIGGGGCFSGAWKNEKQSGRSFSSRDDMYRTRVSRKAIFGACLAPLFFLMMIPMLTLSQTRRVPAKMITSSAARGHDRSSLRTQANSPKTPNRPQPIIPLEDRTPAIEVARDSDAVASEATSQTAHDSDEAMAETSRPSMSWGWVLLVLVITVGVGAPFATTILGVVAISDIRASHGRIVGLPLAMLDALLYPLLILDALIIAGAMYLHQFIQQRFQATDLSWLPVVAVLVTATVCILVDYRIVRSAWRNAMLDLK